MTALLKRPYIGNRLAREMLANARALGGGDWGILAVFSYLIQTQKLHFKSTSNLQPDKVIFIQSANWIGYSYRLAIRSETLNGRK